MDAVAAHPLRGRILRRFPEKKFQQLVGPDDGGNGPDFRIGVFQGNRELPESACGYNFYVAGDSGRCPAE